MIYQDFEKWLEREEEVRYIYKNSTFYRISDDDYYQYTTKLFDLVEMIEKNYNKLPYKFKEGMLYYSFKPEQFSLLLADYVANKFSQIIFTSNTVVMIRI